MARTYEPAQLHGGPLDGHVIQAPMGDTWRMPETVIGVPVPVLDESTETFWWDTGNYFFMVGSNMRHQPGDLWHFHYARTLPGYPTFTEDRDG